MAQKMKSNRVKLPNGMIAIPWKSLPKWVYDQRISDAWQDRPCWYRDTGGINNFEVRFMALPNDPLIVEDGEIVEIMVMSRAALKKALSAYRKNFNRDYDDGDFFDEQIAARNRSKKNKKTTKTKNKSSK